MKKEGMNGIGTGDLENRQPQVAGIVMLPETLQEMVRENNQENNNEKERKKERLG